MTTASPIRLALSLASEGEGALSREPVRTLVEGLADGVAVLGETRGFVRGNVAGRARLGGLDGPACHEVLFGRHAPCPACPLDTGQAAVTAEASCAPLPGRGPRPAGVVCVFPSAASSVADSRLFGVLDHVPSAAFVADRDFRFLYANEAFARLHGRGVGDFVGRGMAETVDPQNFARFKQVALSVLRRGKAEEDEIRIDFGDGEKTFLATCLPLANAVGEVDAFCSTLTETTAHRRVEQELDASRRRYQAIVEDQTELVVRLDPELRRIFVNQAAARFSGRPVEALLGGPFLERVPEVEAKALRQRILALSPRAPVCDIRHLLHRPDGLELCLNWTVRAIFDDAGRVREYQAMGRDVTAYWRMERELVKSETKYRDIFEHSAEGIFQFEPTGTMLACNPALARILGYGSAEEVMLEQGDLFRRIQARQDDRLEFLRLLALQGRVFDFEMQVVRRDGRTAWLSVNARAVMDESGRLARVEGAARDITDRKRAEEERMLLVSAVDQSAEGLVIVSRDFRLEYANPAFAQIIAGGQETAGRLDLEAPLAAFLGESVRKMLGLGLRWSGRVRVARPGAGRAWPKRSSRRCATPRARSSTTSCSCAT